MDIDLLSKMVKELILDKDEVSLPGVGTFVAEMVPSVFSDKGYTINPPYKRLSFRQKGTGDDSLLIDFYAKCNNLDIETASRIIREFLHEMRHVLETRKSIVFPGLGKLRATRENYFFFVADEDLDIYPEGFGLEPISLKTHEETPAEVSATMAALRGILNPEETAAGEVNVNVTPDSVHDFLPSEANVAVKVNIPVREVPVSESTVASSMETEVPSEESDADVAAESFDAENVDAGVHTAETSDVESVSNVNDGMWSGKDSVSGAETSGTESGSDVNAGLESGPDSAAEAVASDDNVAASSAAMTGDANGSRVEATEVPASGSQVNASAESNAALSDIIDNESGAEASEVAVNDIDSVSDREGADAAGQKADAVTTVVSGECLNAVEDVADGQAHAAEAAGQKVEESAGAEGAATAAKVGESAGAEDDAMAAKVEESAGAAVAGEGAAAESGSDMTAAGQGNADNGSSASASPVAKSASDKSGKVIKTMPGRFSKKKPNWRKVLKWSCIGAVLLALTMLLAFIALAHIAPDFIDSILYSPDELRIINY